MARGAKEADPEIVGLELLGARVAQGEQPRGCTGDLGQPLGSGQHRDRGHSEHSPQRSPLLPLGMPPDDVPDLMGEDGSKLRLAVDEPHQAPSHVDVAARRGEGVDHVGVDQSEAALPLEPGGGRDPAADRLEIGRFIAAIGAAELGQQLPVLLGSRSAVAFRDDRTVPGTAARRKKGQQAREKGRRSPAGPSA